MLNTSLSLFVSHGSPMFSVNPGLLKQGLHQLSKSTLRPSAVLVMSPHWQTNTLQILSTRHPSTLHDFGGFPSELYQLQYPASGAPEHAVLVEDLLKQAGFTCEQNNERGLDHGTWVPLMHLFPQADVPVIQLSLPIGTTPEEAWKLGSALQVLRDKNIWVIGSGSMTHNLYEVARDRDAPAHPYVQEFVLWMDQHINAQAKDALCHYRKQAPQAQRAHPTEEHLIPLFFVLGSCKTTDETHRLNGGVEYASLSMDSYAFF